jgi:hypothetical protein
VINVMREMWKRLDVDMEEESNALYDEGSWTEME